MNLRPLSAFFLGVLLFGCAAPSPSDEIFLADSAAVGPFPPEVFFASVPADGIVLPHRIDAHYDGESWSADGVLKITPDALTLVATTPVGRLFTLTWRRATGEVELRRGVVPAAQFDLNPRYLLTDLILIYGDVSALKKNFPLPWEISQSGNTRSLYLDGKEIARIDYAEPPPRRGNVRLENFSRGYGYTITLCE